MESEESRSSSLLLFVLILLLSHTLEIKTQFRLIAPILGVAAFAYSPLLGARVTEVAGIERAGSSAGVTNAFWQLGSVIVPAAVGVVYQCRPRARPLPRSLRPRRRSRTLTSFRPEPARQQICKSHELLPMR